MGELPAWPVFLLFSAFGLWWLLGLGAFAVAIVSLPMAVLLVQRRRVEVPPAFSLWVLLLLWTLAASSQLSSTKLIGFGVRFSNYAGCAILFIYIYNARERLHRRAVLAALSSFYLLVLFGGYLGMFVPHGSISTPTERLLPSSVASNEYVRALVHPAFAEVQQPYGSPRAFYRPSAPFPYTNSWGCNMALLVPLLIAMLVEVRSPRVRIALGAALLAAAVPAAASLNRGMFIGLGVGTAYVAVRLAIRGRVVPLAAVVGSVGVAAVGAVATGVFADLQQRLSYSHTNTGRLAIYRESFDGALSSPLLGNGAPRASETVDVAVGTQGEIWNVMFSFGFVALLWFVGWFVAAWWLSRRAPSVADLWISAVLVVAIATFFFYGYDGPQLAVVMTAAALAVRDRTGARAIRPTTASTRQMLRPVIG